MKLTEDEEGVVVVVVVSDIFSSGFASPKVKPPLAELSVLEDPVPKTIPLLATNFNPEPVAGGSDFLSSLEADPNLKLSAELPNLNPDVVVVSLEVVSDEELLHGTPNLNPPDDEEEDGSENESPNLKPPDAKPTVLSDVPNLKPPELEAEEMNVEEPEFPPANVQKALGSTLAPGLAALQAIHCISAALFCTRQTSQSQAPSGFLNLSPNPNTGAVLAEEEDPDEAPAGLAPVQAAHFVSSALFCTQQVSHSHAPSGFLNLSPNPMNSVETGAVGAGTVLPAEKAEGSVSEGLSPIPGLAVSQATHFTASGLFRTRHVSQSQVPAGLVNIVPKPVVVVVVEVVVVLLLSSTTELAGEGLLSADLDGVELGCGALQQTYFVSDGLFCTKQTSRLQPGGALNNSPNPDEEGGEEVVVEGEVDCVEISWGAMSGPGEVRVTGEANPGALRRSSTLPCFRTLAGFKGPSKSSVLLLAAGFTAAGMGVASFPFDIEGPNLATGALNVNPSEGEKEGGLAAVALTIGEENVKGTQGGVEAIEGSLLVTVSLAGVTAVTLGAVLMVVEVVRGGGGEEKLKLGKAAVLIGSEMVGRSGTSTTSSSSERLEEGRALVLSLFILPPPVLMLLAAGVLDKG